MMPASPAREGRLTVAWSVGGRKIDGLGDFETLDSKVGDGQRADPDRPKVSVFHRRTLDPDLADRERTDRQRADRDGADGDRTDGHRGHGDESFHVRGFAFRSRFCDDLSSGWK